MTLAERIESHLLKLEILVSQFEQLQHERKAAFRKSDLTRLVNLGEMEESLVPTLAAEMQERQQILAAGGVARLHDMAPPNQRERLVTLESRLQNVQEEQSVQVLMVQRAERHVGQLLGTMARGGRKQTCYAAPGSRPQGGTGILLDTTA